MSAFSSKLRRCRAFDLWKRRRPSGSGRLGDAEGRAELRGSRQRRRLLLTAAVEELRTNYDAVQAHVASKDSALDQCLAQLEQTY
jgi:hypothetical protein